MLGKVRRLLERLGYVSTVRDVYSWAAWGMNLASTVTIYGLIRQWLEEWEPWMHWLLFVGLFLALLPLMAAIIRAFRGEPKITLPEKLEMKVFLGPNQLIPFYFVVPIRRLRRQGGKPLAIEMDLDIYNDNTNKKHTIPAVQAEGDFECDVLPRTIDILDDGTLTNKCAVFPYSFLSAWYIQYRPEWQGGEGFEFQLRVHDVDTKRFFRRRISAIHLPSRLRGNHTAQSPPQSSV